MKRVRGQERYEHVEVEADGRDDGHDGEDRVGAAGRATRSRAAVGSHRRQSRRRILLDRDELLLADEQERGQHREEAHRVDDEAEARSDCGDHEAGDRRPDDARAVEEARVERDRVRQLPRADHLEGERLASGRVEREGDAAERSEDVDDRQRRRPGQRDDRERDRDRHRRGLRRHDELAGLDAVGDDAGDESEDGERHEPPEGKRADRERGAGELDDEPRECDVLHPRAGERDELAREEDAVVAVPPQAAERPGAEHEGERRHASLSTSCASAGMAASTASNSAGSSALSRSASQVVRRARTRRISRSPSSVRRRPDTPAIICRSHALEQTSPLEPIDVPGHRRRRDAFLGRELCESETGAAFHEPEERRLARRDAELLGLLPELPRETQEDRPQIGRDGLGIKRNLANH